MNVDSILHGHQVVYVQAYSQPTYALLDSGALPNVMSSSMANTLNVTLKPTNQSIRVASGTAEPCSRIAESVPIRSGSITVHLDFLVVDGVPYDLIIGALVLVKLKAKNNMYKQIVKIRYEGKVEILNLEYEGNGEDDSEI